MQQVNRTLDSIHEPPAAAIIYTCISTSSNSQRPAYRLFVSKHDTAPPTLAHHQHRNGKKILSSFQISACMIFMQIFMFIFQS